MNKKKIKNKGKILLICLSVLAVTGCGGSLAERITRVQGIYADLVSLHNEVVEEYSGLEDNSFDAELDEMAEKIESIGQQDGETMTGEELDAIADEMKQYIETHEEILAAIQEMESGGTEEKIYEVPVTIENNTGVEIYNLYLYKASDTDKGKNLAEDIGYLDAFQTINVLNLYMTEEETLWHLEATEDDGNVIEDVDVDFTGKLEEGTTIVMKFSFDSMEGWVEMQ